MSDVEERFERLERRIEQLENLLRQVLPRVSGSSRIEATREPPPERPRPAAVATPTPPPAPPPPPRAPVAAPAFQLSSTPDIVSDAIKKDRFDLETWVGRRGLLIIGIIALLATGALFLEYAIQHHWIPPLVRSLIAIAAGIGVAYWGHTLIQRDMRKYGGPVVGAGGGLIYLGIWAAAGPFDLIDRRAGIITLAVVATVFALLAQRYEIEGLVISALLGAFAAPLLLRTPTPNPELFLGYVEVVGIGGAIVAYAMEWRRTMFIAVLGYMGLAALILSLDDSAALVRPVGLSFLVVGALLGSEVSRRRPWPEARVITALSAWLLLTAGMPDPKDATDAVRWPAIAAMTVICAGLFIHLRKTEAFSRKSDQQLDERFLYLLTPLAILAFALGFLPGPLAHRAAVVPTVIAVPYLVDGWIHRRAHALMVGAALLAVAVGIQFNPVGAAVGWAVLAAAAAGAFAFGKRPGLPATTAALYALGAGALFVYALPARPGGHAFTDSWALGVWTVLATGALAIWWSRGSTGEEAYPRRVLWWLAGMTLLAGVSLDLHHYFGGASADPAEGATLAFWWMLFAAALARAYAAWKHAPLLPTALALYASGVVALFGYALPRRADHASAVADSWALVLYAAIAIGVLIVSWWSPREEREAEARHAVWWIVGAAVLAGVSFNIERFFQNRSGSTLAADLALSVWWLVFAAGLVAIGFRRDAKVVRSAGLAVAVVATIKVVLYDLSALEALYRIGAFFALALIALGVAYSYHKREPRSSAE